MRFERRVGGKLGSYLARGGKAWDARPDENLLYLGAAQGVTAQHVAGLIPRGTIVAIEKSEVAGLGLLETTKTRANLVPFVGDARLPSSFAPIVPPLGLLYQDIAQRDQVDILLRNARAFSPRRAFLAVKARSIAVEKPPQEVFEQAVRDLEAGGADVVDARPLDPYHKDHAMIVVDLPWAASR